MSASDKGSDAVTAIRLVDTHTGDEVALGISASVRRVPGDKGSTPSEGKGMSAKDLQPLASAVPPPAPADAATSAKPANNDGSNG